MYEMKFKVTFTYPVKHEDGGIAYVPSTCEEIEIKNGKLPKNLIDIFTRCDLFDERVVIERVR